MPLKIWSSLFTIIINTKSISLHLAKKIKTADGCYNNIKKQLFIYLHCKIKSTPLNKYLTVASILSVIIFNLLIWDQALSIEALNIQLRLTLNDIFFYSRACLNSCGGVTLTPLSRAFTGLVVGVLMLSVSLLSECTSESSLLVNTLPSTWLVCDSLPMAVCSPVLVVFDAISCSGVFKSLSKIAKYHN